MDEQFYWIKSVDDSEESHHEEVQPSCPDETAQLENVTKKQTQMNVNRAPWVVFNKRFVVRSTFNLLYGR